MAQDVISTLFNTTPRNAAFNQYMQDNMIDVNAAGARYQDLGRANIERANAMMQNAGTGLGIGIGRLLGGQTPQMAQEQQVQGLLGGASFQDPDQLSQAAERFAQAGDIPRARALMGESQQLRAAQAAQADAQAKAQAEQAEAQAEQQRLASLASLVQRKTGLPPEESLALAQDPATVRKLMETPQDKIVTKNVNGRVKVYRETPNGLEELQDLGAAKDDRPVQTVNVGGGRVGTIPPGFELLEGPDGRLSMVPIAGGPADIAAREAEEAAAKGSEVVMTAAQTVVEDATRALNVLDRFGGLAAGMGGLTSTIPGTAAKELDGHIFSMKGNIGIDQLLKIKQSGAGLGQIPQAQLEMLGSMLGNLDVKQNPRVLRENIKRIEEIYADIVRKEGGDPIAMAEARGFKTEGRPRTQSAPTSQATMRFNPATGKLEPVRN